MSVSWPMPRDHLHGGQNLQVAGSRADTCVTDYINDLDTRAREGSGVVSTLVVTGDIPSGANAIVLDTTAGAVDGTLPPAADSVGREIFVTRVGANAAQVLRAGADTIGAAATSVSLAADGDGVTLVAISSSRWAIKAVV